MTISNDQFRANFPEFASTSTYPDAVVTFWFTFAYLLLNAGRWGNLLDYGAQFFVAHNLVLEGLAQAEAANGAPPGTTVGPISSKSVGAVSVQYDTTSGVSPDDSRWNLTQYGTQFARLFKIIGAGPIQLGRGWAPIFNGPPWPGVIFPPLSGGPL